MWTSVGAGSLQSALVLALKRGLPEPERFLRGRGAARVDWVDGLRTILTVSGWVDSLGEGNEDCAWLEWPVQQGEWLDPEGWFGRGPHRGHQECLGP